MKSQKFTRRMHLLISLLLIVGLLIGPISGPISSAPLAHPTIKAAAAQTLVASSVSTSQSPRDEVPRDEVSAHPPSDFHHGLADPYDGKPAAEVAPDDEEPTEKPEGDELLGGCNPVENMGPCNVGQPVDIRTGNFWHTFNDLSVPGRGPALRFSRTYNSGASYANSNIPNSDRPLGYGWTHNYNMFIVYVSSRSETWVYQENGSAAPFTGTGPTYVPVGPRVMATLTREANGDYIFTRPHGQMRFFFKTVDTDIKLYKIVDRNNYTTTLDYDTQTHQLRTVTDPISRTLTFTHTGALLTSVSDPTNRTVSFEYDTTNNELTDAYDVAQQRTRFTYQRLDISHLMTTMTDPNGGGRVAGGVSPPPGPLRTVRATFTAHGSSNPLTSFLVLMVQYE